MQASLAIINQHGTEGLSLRQVARQAGVSHAAPYAHFADKEDLISAVKDEGFKTLEGRLEQALQDLKSPLARHRLSAIASVYLDFVAQEPAMYRIMFRHPLGKEPRAEFTHIETGKRIFTRLVQEFEHIAKQQKRPMQAQPEMLAIMAWSAVHGLCTLWLDGPLTYVGSTTQNYAQLQQRFVDTLLDLIEA